MQKWRWIKFASLNHSAQTVGLNQLRSYSIKAITLTTPPSTLQIKPYFNFDSPSGSTPYAPRKKKRLPFGNLFERSDVSLYPHHRLYHRLYRDRHHRHHRYHFCRCHSYRCHFCHCRYPYPSLQSLYLYYR